MTTNVWKELSPKESLLIAKIGKAIPPKEGWTTSIEWLNFNPVTGEVFPKKKRFLFARPA